MEFESGLEKEYFPNAVSRRSEVVAWGITLLLISVAGVLQFQGRPIPIAITLLAVFLFLGSAVISFGNWMERETALRITEDYLYYKNGVRRTSLGWDEIQEIELREDRLSKKVTILGESAHFQFRLLSEPRFEGEVRGEFGFGPADEILNEITTRSGKKPKKINRDQG